MTASPPPCLLLSPRYTDDTVALRTAALDQGWGAGLYGCDPAAVLPVLRRATALRGRLTEADAAWVMAR